MSGPERSIFASVPALAALLLCLGLLSGCSLGGGSSKSGGPPADGQENDVVKLRFASADEGVVASTFMKELARVSGGRLVATKIGYEDGSPNVDQEIARDLAAGRLDVADVAVRAWESMGVNGFRAFQSPFLVRSDALMDRAVADDKVAKPLLRSLAPIGVTGLALTPRGVRYLFATKPLDRPEAFEGARVRINTSGITEDILSAMGARTTTAVRSGPKVLHALKSGKLDAVEADMYIAGANGYVRQAPHLSPPLFAKVTSLAVNSDRLQQLGPNAERWLRQAAARAAHAQRATDDRGPWASACGAGLTGTETTPARLEALRPSQETTYGSLDGDPGTALVIDRIGLLATQVRAADPWARCGRGEGYASPTKAIDGRYEATVTTDDLFRIGASPGNEGDYRFAIGNGRFAVLGLEPPDPQFPGWGSDDPVAIGSVVLRGNRAVVRFETSIAGGTEPTTFRYELFRDRLRWSNVSGLDDLVEFIAHPWRKVD